MSKKIPRETRRWSAESVTEGHPDKVADGIADAVLDAGLACNGFAQVACELLLKGGLVVLAGEIDAGLAFDPEAVVRAALYDIGYTDPARPFHADGVQVVDALERMPVGLRASEDVAGDQGIIYGYACNETPERLPLPVVCAHRITSALAAARKSGAVPWLRPDGKALVTVGYAGGRPQEVETVVVSAHHAPEVEVETVRTWLRDVLVPQALGSYGHTGIEVLANTAGAFVEGGPEGDCGVTGRKLMVDTYGGLARHGGGAFSGKDASKLDRSAAYFARWVARGIVKRGIAERAEVSIAYARGQRHPVDLQVDTFGTGDAAAALHFARCFDYRPAAIGERLDLRRPIYRATTHYGHFGKHYLPWES